MPSNKKPQRQFYIEDMIIAKAKESFPLTVTADNFNAWSDYWLAAAEQIKQDFVAEGLTNTAQYVDECIAFNKRIAHNQKVNAALKPVLTQIVDILNKTGRYDRDLMKKYHNQRQELLANA